MENKFIKSLSVVLIVILCRSVFIHKEFYYRMWEENQVTIIFLGLLFTILVLVAIRFSKFENANND